MSSLSTPAIILRRIEYGDFDLILSFLTLEKGKLSAIAKSARKSTKRFGGILELFAALDILCNSGQRSSLPVLQEAALKQPFAAIRASIMCTAYASYWAELIDGWSEEGQQQPDLYELLLHVLTELDLGRTPADVLSILFQVRFLVLSGHGPILRAVQQVQTRHRPDRGRNTVIRSIPRRGCVCALRGRGIGKADPYQGYPQTAAVA